MCRPVGGSVIRCKKKLHQPNSIIAFQYIRAHHSPLGLVYIVMISENNWNNLFSAEGCRRRHFLVVVLSDVVIVKCCSSVLFVVIAVGIVVGVIGIVDFVNVVVFFFRYSLWVDSNALTTRLLLLIVML